MSIDLSEPDRGLQREIAEELDASHPSLELSEEPTPEELEAYEAREEERKSLASATYLDRRWSAIRESRVALASAERLLVEQYEHSHATVRVGGVVQVCGDLERRWRQWASAQALKDQADRQARLEDIKGYAGRLILQRFPDWKQRNMIAFSLDLERRLRRGETPSAAEQAQMNTIDSIWVWVKAVRSYSDTLEQRFLNGEDIHPEAADWPEFP